MSSKISVLFAVFFVASSAASRMLSSDPTLLERLKMDHPGELTSCWDALFKLQSCSGELVLFFMNGETRLGADCCNAIRVIEHDCWPSILGTLGITPEENDILRGYCDAMGGAPSPASTCVPLPRAAARPAN